jgi:hypothetical protein
MLPAGGKIARIYKHFEYYKKVFICLDKKRRSAVYEDYFRSPYTTAITVSGMIRFNQWMS